MCFTKSDDTVSERLVLSSASWRHIQLQQLAAIKHINTCMHNNFYTSHRIPWNICCLYLWFMLNDSCIICWYCLVVSLAYPLYGLHTCLHMIWYPYLMRVRYREPEQTVFHTLKLPVIVCLKCYDKVCDVFLYLWHVL